MSSVDYSRLRSLTARRLIRALLDEGFLFVRQRGSHRRYAHADGRRVTVPFTRSGDTFAAGTLKSIVELQARWSSEDLVRLGLL
ncbi:MAG: type II toxin-antitoxin system HicA family toxin [Chloroflexi bacterium]|nr:type II toxin-antitoxin system HicA family toxin [Chloroflexota bacterium]